MAAPRIPAIWSAGDCASFVYRGARIRLESVQNAIDQAEAVAANMLGADKAYVPMPWFWSDQYDLKLQIAGLNTGYDRVITRDVGGVRSFWYYRGDTFLAVDALNDPRAYMVGKRLLEMGKTPDAAAWRTLRPTSRRCWLMRIVGGTHRGHPAGRGRRRRPGRICAPPRTACARRCSTCWSGQVGRSGGGQRVLDLFAGTGALGLEALSRGAQAVTLVDDGVAARALIRANIEKLRAMGATHLFRRDATDLGENRGAGFGLVFLDPPYGKGPWGARALASALAGGWLAPGAVVVWEENAPQSGPAGFETLDQRRYGETAASPCRPAPA